MEMELIEALESGWFFSNVLTSKPTNYSNIPKSKLKQEPSLESPEPTKPANQISQNQSRSPESSSPPNSPKPEVKHLIRRLVEVPVTGGPVFTEVSMSPRRREEDERRRLRRRQRIYSNRGICRGLNSEGENESRRDGELKSVATCKDERTMKRHLKTWAVAVAVASSVSQTTPMVALCC